MSFGFNGTYEQYIRKIQKKWRKYPADKARLARHATRDNDLDVFPYRITVQGFSGPGDILDDMDNWLRENVSDMDGDCEWFDCPEGWDYWFYRTSGLDQEMDDMVDEFNKNHERGTDAAEAAYRIMMNVYWKRVQAASDQRGLPEDHSHEGRWVSRWLVKTGYDYGFQDYCFKEEADMIHFKLVWAEEICKQ